jgi:hypothetical protein
MTLYHSHLCLCFESTHLAPMCANPRMTAVGSLEEFLERI